ncbi:MAG: hypothetical protein SFZ24_06975 [Planctomycetota bacterium]|nr:hypothetical protein [Planctomycetota bacterium]
MDKFLTRRTAGALLGAVALALPLGGCGSSQTHEYAFDVPPTVGMLAVDVQNYRGSVEIRVDDRVQQAQVVGVVHGNASMGKDAQEAARRAVVEARLVEEGARATLVVRTATPLENRGDHEVDLEVRVPRCEGVRVENQGGNVILVGTGGATLVENRQGVIELRTTQPMVDPVTLVNVDGSIYYQVPPGSTGQFDLETLDGGVWYRDRDSETDRAYAAPSMYQARLADGANPVVARTSRGNINVWIDDDAHKNTRLVKEAFSDPRDTWFLQGSRRYTRNLPESHPEVQRKVRAPIDYSGSY